jgi:hypothetical protein
MAGICMAASAPESFTATGGVTPGAWKTRFENDERGWVTLLFEGLSWRYPGTRRDRRDFSAAPATAGTAMAAFDSPALMMGWRALDKPATPETEQDAIVWDICSKLATVRSGTSDRLPECMHGPANWVRRAMLA